MRLRLSRTGCALAITFLCIAGALFALHWHSFRTNPGDSGESALWFFLCTLPWAFLLPEALVSSPGWDDVAYYIGWAFVAWNAFLLYCIGGGIRLATGSEAPAKRARA
ncbi:MAG TPA: hypothetical protein VLD36_17785 [Burkholderiales bacterium]|nr:hypothetical protein [Burkholderiales bacterium]